MQVGKFVVSFKQLEIVNVDFIVVVAKQKLKISPQPPPCQPCTHWQCESSLPGPPVEGVNMYHWNLKVKMVLLLNNKGDQDKWGIKVGPPATP